MCSASISARCKKSPHEEIPGPAHEEIHRFSSPTEAAPLFDPHGAASVGLLALQSLTSLLLSEYFQLPASVAACISFVALIPPGVRLLQFLLSSSSSTSTSCRDEDSAMKIRSVTAPAGRLEPYKIGSMLTMGFRRERFVWGAQHLPGHYWQDLEGVTDDTADAFFKRNSGNVSEQEFLAWMNYVVGEYVVLL